MPLILIIYHKYKLEGFLKLFFSLVLQIQEINSNHQLNSLNCISVHLPKTFPPITSQKIWSVCLRVLMKQISLHPEPGKSIQKRPSVLGPRPHPHPHIYTYEYTHSFTNTSITYVHDQVTEESKDLPTLVVSPILAVSHLNLHLCVGVYVYFSLCISFGCLWSLWNFVMIFIHLYVILFINPYWVKFVCVWVLLLYF